jgi:hypothetical protein
METRRKRTLSPEPLKVCSLKVTPTAEQFLTDLSQHASDIVGWPVSNSAMFRAVLTYIEQQPRSWAMTALLPHIEQEIAQGRVWGSKKKQE